MTADPLTTKNLAAAFATGGLIVLMIQDLPNWPATLFALLCLIACAGLWIFPERGPVQLAPPRKIHVEIILPDEPETRTLRLLESHPGALELLAPGRPRKRWSLQRWQARR